MWKVCRLRKLRSLNPARISLPLLPMLAAMGGMEKLLVDVKAQSAFDVETIKSGVGVLGDLLKS